MAPSFHPPYQARPSSSTATHQKGVSSRKPVTTPIPPSLSENDESSDKSLASKGGTWRRMKSSVANTLKRGLRLSPVKAGKKPRKIGSSSALSRSHGLSSEHQPLARSRSSTFPITPQPDNGVIVHAAQARGAVVLLQRSMNAIDEILDAAYEDQIPEEFQSWVASHRNVLNNLDGHIDELLLRLTIDQNMAPAGSQLVLPNRSLEEAAEQGEIIVSESEETGRPEIRVLPLHVPVENMIQIPSGWPWEQRQNPVPTAKYVLDILLDCLSRIPDSHPMFGPIEFGLHYARMPKRNEYNQNGQLISVSWESKLSELAKKVERSRIETVRSGDIMPGECWLIKGKPFMTVQKTIRNGGSGRRVLTINWARMLYFLAKPTAENWRILNDKANAISHPFCHMCHNGVGSQKDPKKDYFCINGVQHGFYSTPHFNNWHKSHADSCYNKCAGHMTRDGGFRKCIFVHRGTGQFKPCRMLDGRVVAALECSHEPSCYENNPIVGWGAKAKVEAVPEVVKESEEEIEECE